MRFHEIKVKLASVSKIFSHFIYSSHSDTFTHHILTYKRKLV